MMRRAHHLAGAVAWIGTAPLLHVTGWHYPAGTVLAVVFAAGNLSPDMDRYLFGGRRLAAQHRRLPHWFPIPLAALWAAPHAGPAGWVVQAVAVAWLSHLAGDFVCGKIPVLPRARRGGRGRWVKVGVGWRTGGWAEHWLITPALVVAGVLLLAPPGWLPTAA